MIKNALLLLTIFLQSCVALSQDDLKFIDLTEYDQAMPEFRLVDERSGEYYSSVSHIGSVFVLEFFFEKCPYCHENESNVERLAEEFAGNDKVQILEVSIDCDSDSYRDWIRRHEPRSPVLNDCNGQLVDPLEISGFPTTIVFRPDGQQAMRGSGVWSEATYNRIKDYLNQASK